MNQKPDGPARGDFAVRLIAFLLALGVFLLSSGGSLQSWRDYVASARPGTRQSGPAPPPKPNVAMAPMTRRSTSPVLRTNSTKSATENDAAQNCGRYAATART